MSDKGEPTGLQLWILQAQREILLKSDLRRRSTEVESGPVMTADELIMKIRS